MKRLNKFLDEILDGYNEGLKGEVIISYNPILGYAKKQKVPLVKSMD